MTKKPFRLADIIVGLLVALAFFYLPKQKTQSQHDGLEIAADGKTTIEPLKPDRTLTIAGPLGATTVEIQAGKARITASPCPGKQCVRAGWVTETGGIAACAPNRVAIRIIGNSEGVDAILH